MGVVSGTLSGADGNMSSTVGLLVFLTALLSLSSASLILESPQSSTVMTGSPVSLSCRLDSSHSLHILWYKDGAQLDTRNSLHRLLTLPDGSLFFLSSEASDSGLYQCEVRDDQDQIVEVSQEADLSVLDEDEYYNDVEDSHASLKPESKPEIVSTATEVESSLELDDREILMEIEASTVEGKGDSPSGVVTSKTEIPLVFWIICLSVVSFMTVLVIFGAGYVIFKIKMMKQSGGPHGALEAGDNVYERPLAHRRSWIETPWNFYPSSAQLKTFTNQKLLSSESNSSNSSSDYDYASSDYFLLSAVSGDKSPNSNSAFNSRHYASASINK